MAKLLEVSDWNTAPNIGFRNRNIKARNFD
jgi:hypothetical protein